jgi:hypothetical protein
MRGATDRPSVPRSLVKSTIEANTKRDSPFEVELVPVNQFPHFD